MKEKFSVKQFNQRGFSGGLIIVIVAAVVILAAIGWQIYTSNQQPKQQSANNTSNTQKDPNEGYVVIKEWGVRFKPEEALRGLEYFKVDNNDNFISFTTQELAAKEPNCKAELGQILLGGLSRSKERVNENGGVVAEIDGYIYQYRASSARCSESDLNRDLESKVFMALSRSIQSLEAAK